MEKITIKIGNITITAPSTVEIAITVDKTGGGIALDKPASEEGLI